MEIKKKRRVLNILPFLPWPLATGGHKGCFHAIEAMKDDIDLFVFFPFCDNQRDIDYMRNLWPNVTWIPYYRKSRLSRKWHLKIKSFCFKLQRLIYPGFNEYLEWNFELDSERYEDDFLQCITDSIENHAIDVVQIEFPAMLSLVLWLPDSVKKVFVHHELRFVKNEQILHSKNIQNPYYEFYKRKSQNEEIALLNKYDQVITFSEVDRNKLIAAGVTVPCSASFLIVNQSEKRVFIPAVNKISFLGSGSHIPNVIGLRWFLDSEWKQILNSRPNLKLIIVGRWSKKLKEDILSRYKNVEFSGFVEDLYEELAGSIMIVPLTIGSGIRIKILECTSLSIPFVSTSIGVEGLPFENEKSCIIEDNPELFAQQLLSLLDNPEEQRRISDAAYNVVSTCYSKSAFRASRCSLLDQL